MTRAHLLKILPQSSESFLAENASDAPVKPRNPAPAALPLPAKKSPVAGFLAQTQRISNDPLLFRINIEPRSVQFGKRMGRNKGTGKMIMFCDKRTKEFYAEIEEQAKPYAILAPKGMVHVTMEFHFSRPKRLMTKSSSDFPIWKDSRPDAENLFKGVADPLTKAGFWEDDSVIVHQEAKKFYCAKDEVAHIMVRIEAV